MTSFLLILGLSLPPSDPIDCPYCVPIPHWVIPLIDNLDRNGRERVLRFARWKGISPPDLMGWPADPLR